MPAGNPARCTNAASASAESGVSAAGLETMAHPAATAGANLRASIALGKFQGVMEAMTPTGYLITMMRLSGWWPGMISP